MGRSVSDAPSSLAGAYYHKGSNRHYRVSGGEMARHQVDAAGRAVNVERKRVDFAIGSGNHAKTYVTREGDGRLLQLPLSWYAEEGGKWAMSPGYDRADHLDFRREVKAECLFCHAAKGKVEPIDCERCHGPVDGHLAKPGRGTVGNPARLAKAVQLEVCLQCHLETASSGMVDSIRRVGREVFSYVAGQPLGDYKLYLDKRAAGAGEGMDINHAGYRFLQSPCYLKSGGEMTCTACHDPHRRGVDARAACGQCHKTEHAKAEGDCVSCHMPKRRTRDAVHVVMTDHRVTRKLPEGDLVAPGREAAERYMGPMVRLDLGQRARAEDALYLAAAQLREGNHVREGIAMMERAIAELRPAEAVWYFDLAEAKRREGDLSGAEKAYRAALAREPRSAKILTALGDLLIRGKRMKEAERALQDARAADGRFVPGLNALAVLRGMQGRVEDALALLRESLRVQADVPGTWINLGVAQEQLGDADGARKAYREAIRLQPDSAEARRRLAAAQ